MKMAGLRGYDGRCNKEVTSSVLRLFHIGQAVLNRRSVLPFSWHECGFHVTAENERFTTAGLRCCHNLEYQKFTASFGRLRQNLEVFSV